MPSTTRTRRVMEDDAGKTSGRKERLRGQIGVRTRALSDGWTIGPPAEREYAVEPVGVETINPSDYSVKKNCELINTFWISGRSSPQPP